jgi:cytochrome b
MVSGDDSRPGSETAPVRIPVWDLPTRLFHWLLVAAVAVSFWSGRVGGNAMHYHVLCGEAILALILFRLAWGFVGGREARFAAFVRGPAATLRYARDLVRGGAPRHLGHNPLGAWSILAMLAALLVQVATGLFANDDIFTEGPLASWVSKAVSDTLTRVHLVNRQVLVVLVALHLAAIAVYFLRGENLVTPMITGRKAWSGPAPPPEAAFHARALLVAGIAVLAVYLLVR